MKNERKLGERTEGAKGGGRDGLSDGLNGGIVVDTVDKV